MLARLARRNIKNRMEMERFVYIMGLDAMAMHVTAFFEGVCGIYRRRNEQLEIEVRVHSFINITCIFKYKLILKYLAMLRT